MSNLWKKNQRQAKTRLTARYQIQDILYQSDSMRRCLESVRIFSPGNKTILLEGESGTGKELIAQTFTLLAPFTSLQCPQIR